MKIFSNGFWLIVPILIWNSIFFNRLPAQYQPEIFDKGISSGVVFGEIIFRILVFGLPLLFTVKHSTKIQRVGLRFYLAGGAIYFFSWFPQIFIPESAWSMSLVGFAAPAFTPILWLVGIALLGEAFYFSIEYKPHYYLIPAIIFSVFHCLHVVNIYLNNF